MFAKKFFVCLFLILFPVSFAHAADVKLSWTMPDDNRVTGVEVYHGQVNPPTVTNNGTVTDAGMNTEVVLTGLTEGETYYFAAKSYDVDGNKSMFSDILEYTIPNAPVTRTVQSLGTIKSFTLEVIME